MRGDGGLHSHDELIPRHDGSEGEETGDLRT